MGIRCFLIEPVYYRDPAWPNALFGRSWVPDNLLIRCWRRADTGEELPHTADFGVGAIWCATWYPKNMTWDNETGPHLIVRCPSGRDWDIDSRCSNCTLPNDRAHRCWRRHGVPPNVTVDKIGATCAAGAGSILLPNWHGFLRGGELVEA